MSGIPKVLVIGLDAATPRLVERWVAEGRLPNIGRFLSEGAWGPMRSVPNRHSAPAWSTMVTGLNPGKHGIFWFTEDIPENYEHRFVNGSFRRGKPFWRVLSDVGQSVGVVNVPLTFPAEEVNGVFVAGLDSPSADDPRFTHPPGLRHEVREAAGGEYSVHPDLPRYVIAGEADEGLNRLHRLIDRRAALAKHLMSTRPWDTFMVVFTETDVVQHFFWRQMEFPAGDDPSRHRSAIRDTYEHCDRVVGELMEAAGEDALVMLVSDHGARYDNGLARAVPSWLEQLGLLSYRTDQRTNRLRSLAQRSVAVLFRQADKRLSFGVKHKLARRLPWLRRRVDVMMSFANVDWRRTRAYTDGKRPEIWINLRGRQAQGIVEPSEYESVRQSIIDTLSSAVCAETGEPLIRKVWRREEAYTGPFVERSPDLVIEWSDAACLKVRYPDGTTHQLHKRHLPDDPFDRLLNGGHDQNGIVALLGPGVRSAAIAGAEIGDVAPTVLFLRDVPIPADVDGKVLTDAFAPELLESRQVRREDAAAPTGGNGEVGYSVDEEAEIHERLQALGYVD